MRNAGATGGRGRSSSTNRCACSRSTGSGALSSETATNIDHVGGDAPQHAVRQRLEAQVEQRLRGEEGKSERAFRHDGARQPACLDDPGQQQRVGPHRKAGDDAGDGAARGGVAPDQAAEEGRRELRDGGKRDEADGGQRRAPGRAADRTDSRAGRWRRWRRGGWRAAARPCPAARACSSKRSRSRSGTTRPLQTMMARATESTITMAVAADRPPTKASSVTTSAPADSGRPSTYMSASKEPRGRVMRPAAAIGTTNRLISTR